MDEEERRLVEEDMRRAELIEMAYTDRRVEEGLRQQRISEEAEKDREARGRPISVLCVLAVVVFWPGAACAESHSKRSLQGVYAVDSGCSNQPAPDVDVIEIAGDVISDVEDECTMTDKSVQPDGIVKFTIRCQSDNAPRTGPGFVFRLGDGRIILDYGLGPSIWHRCK